MYKCKKCGADVHYFNVYVVKSEYDILENGEIGDFIRTEDFGDSILDFAECTECEKIYDINDLKEENGKNV